MEEKNRKLGLQVSFDQAIGSFAILDYETQKQAFIDYINALQVKPLTNEIDRKKYTANRASLNKLRDEIKSQRIATTKLISTQFTFIEKLIDSKSKEYNEAVKAYDAEQEEKTNALVVEETEVVVGKEETHTLVLNGSKIALEQVLQFANTLGLQREIK